MSAARGAVGREPGRMLACKAVYSRMPIGREPVNEEFAEQIPNEHCARREPPGGCFT